MESLEDLLADPDEMRMQALVIRERILGPAHPDTSYYIRYRGAVYADAGKFNRSEKILDRKKRKGRKEEFKKKNFYISDASVCGIML